MAGFLSKNVMKEKLLDDHTGIEVESGQFIEINTNTMTSSSHPPPPPPRAEGDSGLVLQVNSHAPLPAAAGGSVGSEAAAQLKEPPQPSLGLGQPTSPCVVQPKRLPLDQEIDEFVDKDAAQVEEVEEKQVREAPGAGLPQPEAEEEEEDETISNDAARWGAAGAGCGVGYLVGGIFVGLIGGAAAAYAAGKEGKVGDAARSTGRCVILVKNKALRYNRRHKVTEKVGAAASGALVKTKEFNEKHRITERSWNAMKGGFQSAKEFNQKHQISTRMASGLKAGASKLEGMLTKKKPEAYVPPEVPLGTSSPLEASVTAVVMDSQPPQAQPPKGAPSATDLNRV